MAGSLNRKGSKPSCRFQAKPEHCCLWFPGFYEIQGFCKSYGITVRAPGRACTLRDPKSELYEDLCAYLKDSGYVVKQLNLIQLTHSDAWNCLAEIDEGELIDVFCDVVIRNTTDKFDHFTTM